MAPAAAGRQLRELAGPLAFSRGQAYHVGLTFAGISPRDTTQTTRVISIADDTEPRTTLLSIVRIVGTRLSAHRFSRRGLTLLKRGGDSTALINFQSTSSSRERLKFTVIGSKFECLLSEREKKSTSVWDSHVQWRSPCDVLPEASSSLQPVTWPSPACPPELQRRRKASSL